MKTQSINYNAKFVLCGMAFLLFGLFYYIFFRDIGFTYLYLFQSLLFVETPLISNQLLLTNLWLQSIPSFIYVLSFSFLTLGILELSRKKLYLVPAGWLIINIIYEFSQWRFTSIGTFDWHDIAAGFIAYIFVIALIKLYALPKKSKQPYKFLLINSKLKYLLNLSLVTTGILSIMGTSEYQGCADCGPCYSGYCNEAVYMSYDDLRSSVSVMNNRDLTVVGKIYIYQDYIYINSPNQGIHIINNSDPTTPINRKYINVPGNVDIAIKDGYLYADSYIDMVVLDIRDIDNIRVVSRVENIFPYNAYQNLPEGIYLDGIDREKGVVVGYKERDDNV